jgi:hypothetical protein
MSHRDFAYTLAVDVTAAVIVACAFIGVALVAPDWLVGVLCVGLVPALVLGIVGVLVVTARRGDPEFPDAGVAQPVEHRVPSAKVAGSMPAARFPLASPCRGASRGSSPRGSGSRQPSERLAGSNPFPFDWPER